jgi:Rad51 protein
LQTRSTIDPLQPKTWQLDTTSNGVEGYLYNCVLCDEALVLSKKQINPQKIQIIFNNTCPGCGFQLDKVLDCRSSVLLPGRRLLTSLKCPDARILLEPDDPFEYPTTQRGSTLPSDPPPSITTGIETIDKILVLKRGQMVFLQGEPSNALSLLLCVRATLPPPHGLDSDVVFIDAGNLFDTYTISQHTINQGLNNERVQERIHLSRAFTHHQVYNLIIDKLLPALDEYEASFAVVSDITALFCDPDVRDKRESLDIFRRSIQFLAKTAEKRDMLTIVTSLKTRSKTMEDALTRTANVSATLKDKDAYSQLTVARHPLIPEKAAEVTLDNRTLTGYFQSTH